MLEFPELIRYSRNYSLLGERGFELKNKVLATGRILFVSNLKNTAAE